MSEKIKNINLDPNQVQARSIKERIFYALLFEVIGIWLSARFATLFSSHPMSQMLVVTLIIAIIAMIWNIVYNTLFDRWLKKNHIQKNMRVRMLHMVIFEVTLTIFTLPFIVFYLHISLLDAILLDAGFTIFFMIYTYVYNWLYDHIRVLVFKYFILKGQ